MSQELSQNQDCVIIRNGIEIWLDPEKSKALQDILVNTTAKFIRFQGRTINTADVVGVYNAQDMEAMTRRKNGEWKCQHGAWHEKNTQCECKNETLRKLENEERKKQEQEILNTPRASEAKLQEVRQRLAKIGIVKNIK